MKDKKLLKYFEYKVPVKKWDSGDYFIFLGEAVFNNIFPFFIGYIVATTKVRWVALLLALPVYLRFKLEKSSKKKTKRIYIR